jgi:hypothetical protein
MVPVLARKAGLDDKVKVFVLHVALADLALVLPPVVSCCLPVTGISAAHSLRWRAKAS